MIFHQRIITPMMVSNRSIISTSWSDFKPEGTSVYVMTSVGNEELEKKYAKNIGKDVISTCHLNHVTITPNETGITIRFMVNIDVAGSLPDFVKSKIGEAQAGSCDAIVDYIKKNYKA